MDLYMDGMKVWNKVFEFYNDDEDERKKLVKWRITTQIIIITSNEIIYCLQATAKW